MTEEQEKRMMIGKVYIDIQSKNGENQQRIKEECIKYMTFKKPCDIASIEMYYDCFIRERDLRNVETIVSKGRKYFRFTDDN